MIQGSLFSFSLTKFAFGAKLKSQDVKMQPSGLGGDAVVDDDRKQALSSTRQEFAKKNAIYFAIAGVLFNMLECY